jgi:hypothetical protein
VSLDRRHLGLGATKSYNLSFLTKQSSDTLPASLRLADCENVAKRPRQCDCEDFPPKYSWCSSVITWLKEPLHVLKVLAVRCLVLEPKMVDGVFHSPPRMAEPIIEDSLLVHFEHVLDRKT